ncbi:MAG TPA: hypothetical protein IGS40_05900 [Trichormus sp. M33_DOE_039]|nr:hypothetical protein [Trichormus sp. M33_DOE_039]
MTAVAISRETRRHLRQVGHCPPNAVSPQRTAYPIPNSQFPIPSLQSLIPKPQYAYDFSRFF